MAWSMRCSLERIPEMKSDRDLVFVQETGNTSWPKLSGESDRRPVKIRPPRPRSPPSRQPPVRSVSCEPPPKPIIRRRAQSLPSPPERRRLCRRVSGVRFVDSLGLQLENVKVFSAGDDPSIPEHVLFRLLMNAELAGGRNLEISLPYLKPMFFEQPGDQHGFQERLWQQYVCLERVRCCDFGVIGTLQVLNVAFEKVVSIRYSFTNWKSFTEARAHWVSNKCKENDPNGLTVDSFRFHLPVPSYILQPGAVLEFAICYNVLGTQYWDNNEGQNYKLACHSYKLTVPKECEDSMIHFI